MEIPPCPSISCSLSVSGRPSGQTVRAGYYRNRILRRKIQRYRCKICGTHYSSQTHHPTYYQKRPDLNPKIRDLLCSQVSQRRSARLLGVSRRTVVKKFRFMARLASIENEKRLHELALTRVNDIQFDDLITSIHTKCKPVSVSLAVNGKTREILGFQVSDLPARHPLVEVALAKYGQRKDERPFGLGRLFTALSRIVNEKAKVVSDCDPEYPGFVSKHLPTAHYERIKSRRARSQGFGELKRIGFDPIFSLNHTCAMLRANLNRLARSTWATSKTKIGLIQHLELYAHYHNTNLIERDAV